MHELFDSLLPYLTPSEQAVYLRLWRLSHGDGKDQCAIRYDDLAKLAHVSRSTLKRTLKKLIQRKLVKVEWYTKRASVFTISIRPLSPAKTIDLGITVLGSNGTENSLKPLEVTSDRWWSGEL